MSFFIVSHFEFLVLVNKNNPFYGLLGCELSIGVIPITSVSKLFVGIKPGFRNEPLFIGLIGVIPISSITKVPTELCCSKIFSVTKLPSVDCKWSLSLSLNLHVVKKKLLPSVVFDTLQ